MTDTEPTEPTKLVIVRNAWAIRFTRKPYAEELIAELSRIERRRSIILAELYDLEDEAHHVGI